VAAHTVHFDDSGTHPESTVAVIGGWIAPVPQWKKFTRDWNKAKKEYGFEVFHAAEFMFNNPKSEFADKTEWTEQKKQRVLSRLASITLERISQGFCLRVVKADYDALVPESKRDIVGRHHYTYALRAAIGFIEQWREKNSIDGAIEYVFDRMAKGRAKIEIERVFAEAELLENPLNRYGIYKGCHSFRDKAEILPLQSSDMLAWLSRRAYAYEFQGESMPQYAIEVWNRLLLSKRLMAKAQPREALADFMAKDPKALASLPKDWRPQTLKKPKAT
jgi:hypothetical protein